MTDVTQLLHRINEGDDEASEELYSAVYAELRKIALSRLRSPASQELFQPTELVHEAYLKLTKPGEENPWQSRAHLFGAAAEAMRRIIIDQIRAQNRQKRGGQAVRFRLSDGVTAVTEPSNTVLEVNEAIEELEQHDSSLATLVKLRFFVGMKHQEAADVMGISRRQADRLWALARAWLYRAMHQDDK